MPTWIASGPGNDFPLHLSDEGDRPAEANEAQSQEVEREFAHGGTSGSSFRGHMHSFRPRLASITRRRTLQHAFKRSRQPLAPQFHFHPGKPHLITATVVLAAVDAEFILLDPPFAFLPAPHRIGSEV